MSEHYFSAAPTSASRPARFEAEILGMKIAFTTDAGVFSRGEIDEGTRILLEALPEISGRALDLGCGWGAVGVTLAKKYPDARLVMADVNERALELARKNLADNGVKNAEVLASDAFMNISGAFDFIITNPPIRAGKAVIYGMFDGAKPRLLPGGRLYIVIRKQQGAPSALKHLEGVYPGVRVIAREKGFWVIECENHQTEG